MRGPPAVLGAVVIGSDPIRRNAEVADSSLHGGDLAQAVVEQAAVQRRKLGHGDDVAGACARRELLDLVGHPQALQHHEHLTERRRVPFGECAVGRGGRKARRCRRRRDVTGEPTPSRQVDDRCHRVALEVERATAAGQYVAQGARADPVGERVEQLQPKRIRVFGAHPAIRRWHRVQRGIAPHHPAVEQQRREDQALVDQRVVEPILRRAWPNRL